MPLFIACSVKVNHKVGAFKPEYIIPQLLMQYVVQNTDIDGIKFPSTKLDYSSIEGFAAYNYVFPIKKSSKNGYCDDLMDKFHVSQPTSLEYEDLMFNTNQSFVGVGLINKHEKIEIIKGVKRSYGYSSFGKIESALKDRPLYQIQNK